MLSSPAFCRRLQRGKGFQMLEDRRMARSVPRSSDAELRGARTAASPRPRSPRPRRLGTLSLGGAPPRPAPGLPGDPARRSRPRPRGRSRRSRWGRRPRLRVAAAPEPAAGDEPGAARGAEQPRPHLPELRCGGSGPGGCRWRGQGAGSGPERASASGAGGIGGRSGASRGGATPALETGLPSARPCPGDAAPPPGAVVVGAAHRAAPAPPERAGSRRVGDAGEDTAGWPGDVPGPDSPTSGSWRPGRPGLVLRAKPPFSPSLPRFTPRTKGWGHAEAGGGGGGRGTVARRAGAE